MALTARPEFEGIVMECVPAKFCCTVYSFHDNDTVLAVVLWDERRGYASCLPTKRARLRRISSSTNSNMIPGTRYVFWEQLNLKLY